MGSLSPRLGWSAQVAIWRIPAIRATVPASFPALTQGPGLGELRLEHPLEGPHLLAGLGTHEQLVFLDLALILSDGNLQEVPEPVSVVEPDGLWNRQRVHVTLAHGVLGNRVEETGEKSHPAESSLLCQALDDKRLKREADSERGL